MKNKGRRKTDDQKEPSKEFGSCMYCLKELKRLIKHSSGICKNCCITILPEVYAEMIDFYKKNGE